MLSILMSIVSIILPIQVVSVVISIVSIWKSFPRLLFCGDHLFYCASELFIVSWVFFAKVLKLPHGHDPMGESLDYLSFSDVMYLST
jgi:hypothetical protein